MSESQHGNGTNFFSSGLARKIDQLMDVLYAGGVNNPMDAIEQISYLLFLRLLWERDETRSQIQPSAQRLFAGEWARYGWGSFVTLTGDELFDSLRQAIERIHELPGLSETGRLLFERATLKIYDRPTLRAVVQGVAGLEVGVAEGAHLKGDMYEYLLSKLSTAGTNGQFRTPRHIINMIVRMVDPQPSQRVCDPAVGTAGFLVAAYNHILRSHTPKADLERGNLTGETLTTAEWDFLEQRAFTGFDNDANMVKLAILNLYLHRLERADIRFFNPLTTAIGGTYPGPRYDVILANPPFSGSVQAESINENLNAGLNTRSTELLFLKWFIDHLVDGGRAGVIVPSGVLFGSTKAAKKLRQRLIDECDLEAVVSLPSGVFKPYSGVATAVLVFRKGAETEQVWFYEVTADGFSLDDNRAEISDNDIPDVLSRFPDRQEGPHSFSVAADRLREEDFSLALARYKPMSAETHEYDDPVEILDGLVALEQEILSRAEALREEVGE